MFRSALALALVATAFAAPFPQWPENYLVEGTFTLKPVDTPHVVYSNVTIYYDSKLGGYQAYDGTANSAPLHTVVQSLQAKKTYEVVDAYNTQLCAIQSGGGPSLHAHAQMLEAAGGDAIAIQVGLPAEGNFSFVGQVSCPAGVSGTCNHWELIQPILGKVNFYELYVTTEGIPVQYEFLGYDTLFGSHFDHYVMVYNKYVPHYRNAALFAKPSACDSVTQEPTPAPTPAYAAGATGPHRIHTALPSKAHAEFRHFASKHGKSYSDAVDFNGRLFKFTDNLVYINNHNDAGKSYKMAVNHMSDLSQAELRERKGLLGNGALLGEHEIFEEEMAEAVPASVDWRRAGLVSPVKDQGVCGSCWSFSATGALEGQYKKKYNNMKLFSQQWLVDCAWNATNFMDGNQGCGGGFQSLAYGYIKARGGIPTTIEYGPYLMVNKMCPVNYTTTAASINGYTSVPTGNEKAMKAASSTAGPLAVSIDASHRSFTFYSSGVYYEPKCSSVNLDHAVLAIGYGVENGQDYWLVKNSWSTFWGDFGYVKMARNRDNNCGIATGALYPNVQ